MAATIKLSASDEDEKTTEVKRKRRRPKRGLTGDEQESPKAQQPETSRKNINKGTTPTQNNSAENQHKEPSQGTGEAQGCHGRKTNHCCKRINGGILNVALEKPL